MVDLDSYFIGSTDLHTDVDRRVLKGTHLRRKHTYNNFIAL
jgi:hypothetical protein